MKAMVRLVGCFVLFLRFVSAQAQEVKFDQGNWQNPDITKQRILATVMHNEERIDSVYTEDLETGEMQLHVQRYPLARYEYYPASRQFPALQRRIDIRQEEVMDTMFVEDMATGDVLVMVRVSIIDIPNGAYREFFPNGNIRIMGTLDGYNPDGTLKKTGEWKEWDADGNVIRREEYP